jgi:hypothetical protein
MHTPLLSPVCATSHTHPLHKSGSKQARESKEINTIQFANQRSKNKKHKSFWDMMRCRLVNS